MSETFSYRTSRDEAMTVQCPTCAAPVSQECVDSQGRWRASCHGQRHEAAVRAGAKPIITREQWGARQRARAHSRRVQGGYGNLRRDGW